MLCEMNPTQSVNDIVARELRAAGVAAQPVPTAPRNPFRGVKRCVPKQPLEPVYATRFFSVIGESISNSALVKYVQQQWQGWGKKA